MEANEFTRREFIASGIAASASIPVQAHLSAKIMEVIGGSPDEKAGVEASRVLKVGFRSLISHADLVYTEPLTRSEAGQPLGNGRMGSLIWTTPTTVNLQVNRVDVYAQNKDTHSFPERNTDYGTGCAYVDLNVCDFGEDVFNGPRFNQHLSVYDGMVTIAGNGVTVRVTACQDHDVFSVEIDDSRAQPAPIQIDLRMLRYLMQYIAGENFRLSQNRSVKVVTHSQSSTSTLEIRDGQIVLGQEFREGGYYNASAVVARVVGRRSKAKYANEGTVRLGVPAARGRFTVLIASAASFDPEVDVVQRAVAELDAVGMHTFDTLASSTAQWWHGFWSKSFVHMETSDLGAREIERSYTYYLYVMGASSRGAFIPKYGGMLWFTNGDMRAWGAQHWWHNGSCDYNALPAANRSDLMQPVFRMYSGMYESSALAARQQWGSEGIFIPEVTWFDGLEELPEDIAAEMRELYLMRKPWEERSERFRHFAETKTPHNSRWNWKDRGKWVDGEFVWKDRVLVRTGL